jgi:hypothetical protein
VIRINYIPRTVCYEALKLNNKYYCYGTPTEVCPLSKQIITFQEQTFRISVLSPFSRSTQEAMHVWRNISAHFCKHCWCGKAISISYSERVSVALGTHHAWAYTILSTVVCLALPYFFILSRFLEKIYGELNMCLDFLYNFCLKYLSFSEELSEIWSKMYIARHINYPLFLSDFNENWIFVTNFRKILKYDISWENFQ